MLLVEDERRQASLGVAPVRQLAAEVPEGAVQHPGRPQVGGVHQVEATLGVEAEPLTAGGLGGHRDQLSNSTCQDPRSP